MSEHCAELHETLQRTQEALAEAHRRIASLETRIAELEARTDIAASTQALAEERNLLRTLIDSVPDYIYVKDTEHRYLLNNVAHAKAIANLTPEQMAGRKVSDFLPPRMVEMFQQDDSFILESGQPLIDRQEYFIGMNGQPFWHSTTKVPLKNLKGEIVGLVGITRNISERKRAEQALEQALEKERDLVELKTRFVSMASHEFRTPLAMILSATEILQRYRARLNDNEVEKRLKQIHEQVMYLRDIMENMLQMSQGQNTELEANLHPTDLDGLCRTVVDEFCNRPDVRQTIRYTCDSPPRLIALNKNRMRQVIINLVANAVKYSPPDTTVSLSLIYTPEAAVLRVSDQGIGIPDDDQRYLFEMFHRASNVSEIAGTGLGLVIAKQVVDLHGGTISLQSKLGVGTTFTVKLPYAEND